MIGYVLEATAPPFPVFVLGYAINGFGLRVIALDTGSEKEALCKKLGAETFVDFKVCARSLPK